MTKQIMWWEGRIRGEDEVRRLPIIRAMHLDLTMDQALTQLLSSRRAVRKGEYDPLKFKFWVVQPRSQGSHLKLSSMPGEHDCCLALSWGRSGGKYWREVFWFVL